MRMIYYVVLLFALVFRCNHAPYHNDPIPEHDSFQIESKQVGETRVINIWTPPMYDSSSDTFPVLYMPDGGIKEDFPHIANTLAKLIKEKSIPPYILVGIENTERGRDLTGYSKIKADERYCPLTNGAKNFRAFIISELIPEINNKYRTVDKKGIIGESLAGLFVMETFLEHPESFDKYIAMDPSLWWNNHFLVRNATDLLFKFPNKNISLWFAGSGNPTVAPYTKELERILLRNAPNSIHWKYSDEPEEKHNTIFRATKEKAIIWALNS